MIMQLIVKMLIAFFVVSITSGCSSKLIMVPIACEIPKVEEPMIDTVDKDTTLGESKRCARNYFIMRESYEKLKKVVEVCQ